jgi:hypothetical protein
MDFTQETRQAVIRCYSLAENLEIQYRLGKEMIHTNTEIKKEVLQYG